MKNAMKTGAVAIAWILAWAAGPNPSARAASTYLLTDLGYLASAGSFATGINNSNQVSGYSIGFAGESRAWRFTPETGLLDLGSLGGTESRALSLNQSGQVVGYSKDSNGLSQGFLFDGAQLIPLAGFGGAEVYPQHINNAGRVAGFSSANGSESPFLLAPPDTVLGLGALGTVGSPDSAAAYGLNDLGQLVGIGTWPDGFNRAFRTGPSHTYTDLGTLGGDASWAYAINNGGQVVGSATAVTTDTHAFLFSDNSGMTDLGTLGGYTSTAFGLNSAGEVVGSAETPSRQMRAVVWSSSQGIQDLNELIPVDAGWELTEARGINDSGVIVGTGLLRGQPRAFLLTPATGPDTRPPVVLLQAANITNILYSAQLLQVAFWDDVGVSASSITTNCLRVTGPGGFDQVARFYGPVLTTNAIKLTTTFYVSTTNGLWNGTNNGVYSVSLEPDTVRDVNGNVMPSRVIGTFTVAAETRPVISLSPETGPVMNQSQSFTLNALGSFPYDTTDSFHFVIDWNNDGSEVQSFEGPSGTQVTHTFLDAGIHLVRTVGTDPHGVSSDPMITTLYVGNPPDSIAWVTAPSLTSSRRLAIGLNQGGTLVCIGGLPIKGGGMQAQTLAPGASSFVDARRLNAATIGIGAGVDSLNRIVLFGGIEPGATAANLNGYVYSPGSGVGAAIAPKKFAVHDFAFCADDQHRLYSIGGATDAASTAGTDAVERYDAASNSWTPLASLPAPRINAAATRDRRGHILVIGGLDPATGAQTTTVFSYDIAANSWSVVGNSPSGNFGPLAGRVAALGADGMVYLTGGMAGAVSPSTEVLLYDSAQNIWLNAPRLSSARGTPAVALGNDGFLYAMGGDAASSGGGGNNGQSSVERLDTLTPRPPAIVSSPLTSVQAGNLFSYQIVASGAPRPAYSLVNPPNGMTLEPASGWVEWRPGTNQVGDHSVTVRAVSPAGSSGQTFILTVRPIPGDVTPPTAPTNFFAAFRSATGVTFTWSGATDDVGVVSYNIYNLVGSRSRHWALLRSGITNRSFITPSSTFAPSFAVAAVDAAGNVSPLKIGSASALTLPLITHSVPSEPATVILGSGFLFTLSASASPMPGFSGISGPQGMTLTPVEGPNPLNDYAVVQWQPGPAQVGTNFFTVYATNANTTGGSATFSVVVLPGGTDLVPPTPVASLGAALISFDHCDLVWTPAGDNVGVSAYLIKATHFGSPSNQVITLHLPGTQTNTTLSGLLEASGYTVSITPSDAAGNVGGTTSFFLTTLPRPQVSLRLTAGIEPGTLLLDWSGMAGGARFTVESSDAIIGSTWMPVQPAAQWPSDVTRLVITPDPATSHRFYRVVVVP